MTNFVKEFFPDNFITLCGDDGQKQICNITRKNINNKLEAQIGVHWQSLCWANGFKSGDEIRFKFDLKNLFLKCNVFKVNLI